MLTYGDPRAALVLLQPVDGHGQEDMDITLAELDRRLGAGYCLRAFPVEDWNVELSPWAAPAVFGGTAFGAGAEETLKRILAHCGEPGKTYLLGGYSLAGLFALWAGTRTGVFQGVAAASPSVWFPGWTAYLRGHPLGAKAAYLSLGDREAKTRQPLLATVADRLRETEDILNRQGVATALAWNPGNHFRDPALRMAWAFAGAAATLGPPWSSPPGEAARAEGR